MVASDWNNGVVLKKKKCCRMVHTRQGLGTDPSLVRRRGCGSLYGNETKRDPLKDIASHLPTTLAHSDKGESARHQDDSTFHTIEVLLTGVVGGRGPEDRPSLVVPIVTPNPY